MDAFVNISKFLTYFNNYSPNFMWLLGAGAPRSAGLPTAYDIVWDLKKAYYAREEHVNIDDLNIGNDGIKRKIQNYLDSKGCPSENSLEEYSFYFDLLFGKDRSLQRQYLMKQLIEKNFEPNIGFKILAALMSMDMTKLVFTTNFDDIFEKAYANILGQSLRVYHLEGAEGAVNAINNNAFPFYVKLHGDYQFQSIKNLSQDLLNNNQELEKCFLSASTRFGLIVAGYSGRDINVMSLLNKAIEMPNPFPQGIFWMAADKSSCLPSVHDFIRKAKLKGINAEIIEIDSFDSLMNWVWTSVPGKSLELSEKLRIDELPINIPVPQPGKSFPVIRLNAFPIKVLPQKAVQIADGTISSIRELKEKCRVVRSRAIMTKKDNILAWGAIEEIQKVISNPDIISDFEFTIEDIVRHGYLKDFIYRGLVTALCKDKPLSFRKIRNTYYIVPKEENINDTLFVELRTFTDSIAGTLLPSAQWFECLKVKIDFKNDSFWLVVKPDIWIDPSSEREKYISFLRNRSKNRYNDKQNIILDIWKKIIFDETLDDVEFPIFQENNEIKFIISPVTAFAFKGDR